MRQADSTAARFPRGVALLAATALFMEILDGTIIQTAIPAIAEDFEVPPESAGITIVAYLLAVGACIPASGWLAERYGIRRIFLTSVLLFTLASVICAVSPDLVWLTAGRTLQGIGGALMVPVARFAVLRVTTPSQLLDAIAYLTWPALVAPVIAPALGGLLTDTVGWPWIFLMNIPLGAAALVAGWMLLRPADAGSPPRFDTVGFCLVAAAMIGITVGAETIAGGDWTSFIVGVATLGGGFALCAVAAFALTKRSPSLLDLSALRHDTFRVGNVSGAVYRLMITAAPFLFTMQFQVAFGMSALAAGLLVIAVFAGNVLIKPFTTPIIRRWGFRRTLIVSNALGVVLLATCATFTVDTPTPVIIAVLFAGGVFRSIGFSAYNTLQFADVSAEEMSNANTLSSTLHQAATALGIAAAVLFIRVGTTAAESTTGTPDPGYSWSYILGAAVLVVPLVAAIRLRADAGVHATQRG